jgi:23S rRNA (cytosine1962-C5)-methyltransferase
MQEIIISKETTKKVKSGFLWIFSNQIVNSSSLTKKVCVTEVYDTLKNYVGIGVYNPHSLIAVRMLSYDKNVVFDKKFFVERLTKAVSYRLSLGFDTRYCRICYGESDFLPGVVIDRYNDVLVVQFYSAGMELFVDIITESLIELFNPTNIILRNDFSLRKYENVDQYSKIVYSKKNLDNEILITHLDTKFYVDVIKGQKTGFYYDQKLNREYLTKIVKNKSVLDLCCYTGSFSIIAKRFGAKKVLGIDSSLDAINLATKNAKINNVEVEFIKCDVEEFVKTQKNKYDIVLFDPPSYCKSKKDKIKSIKKYTNMCSEIFDLLNSDGILHFSVCSYHIDWQDIKDIISQSLVNKQKKGYIINYGIQSLDHPIYNLMKETEYLKCVTVVVK